MNIANDCVQVALLENSTLVESWLFKVGHGIPLHTCQQ